MLLLFAVQHCNRLWVEVCAFSTIYVDALNHFGRICILCSIPQQCLTCSVSLSHACALLPALLLCLGSRCGASLVGLSAGCSSCKWDICSSCMHELRTQQQEEPPQHSHKRQRQQQQPASTSQRVNSSGRGHQGGSSSSTPFVWQCCSPACPSLQQQQQKSSAAVSGGQLVRSPAGAPLKLMLQLPENIVTPGQHNQQQLRQQEQQQQQGQPQQQQQQQPELVGARALASLFQRLEDLAQVGFCVYCVRHQLLTPGFQLLAQRHDIRPGC